MRKFFFPIFGILFLFNIYLIPICYSVSDSVYTWSQSSDSVLTSSSNTEPISNTITLESGAGILIEQNSGRVLFEQNSHEQLRPASVTKVMTILLVMEALDSGKISLTDKIPCSENAASMGGSQIWLDVREELTVDEMLKAMCVVSANDCTVAMAEYLAGSQEAFVEQMNKRAKELGMNDTCFKNCHGIDEDGHVSSAYDISLMSRELLINHPQITKYTTIWMDTLRDGKSSLVNTNKLIRNYKGATGLKTGSTSLALYNLSASATRDDLSLIAVIMKAPSTKVRFAEAQKLLDYGFSNFQYKCFGKQGDIIKNIPVNNGTESNINLVLAKNSGALLSKGASNDISQEINIPESIPAPITSGQKIGEIRYFQGNVEVEKSDIIAEKSIDKISFVALAKKIYLKYFSLLKT